MQYNLYSLSLKSFLSVLFVHLSDSSCSIPPQIFSGDSGSSTGSAPDVPPPPIPAAPSSRKPREFEDSCGYRIPSQIISTSSNPSSRYVLWGS